MSVDYLQPPQTWICMTHLTCHLSWLCLDQGFLFQGDHLFLCKKRQRMAFIWETISHPNKKRTENPIHTVESWVSIEGEADLLSSKKNLQQEGPAHRAQAAFWTSNSLNTDSSCMGTIWLSPQHIWALQIGRNILGKTFFKFPSNHKTLKIS